METSTNKRLNPLYEVKLINHDKKHYYQIGEEDKWYPGVTTVLNVINKPSLLPWAVKSVCENVRGSLEGYLDKPLTREDIDKILTQGKNIYKKKSGDAAGLGSRIHHAIDEIIHGKEPVIVDEEIKPGVQSFLVWKEANKIQIELGDTKLGSKLFGYGGSLDFVAFEDDEPIIVDIKTSRKRKGYDHGAYPEMALQLGAYAQAFHETYGLNVKRGMILWLNKDKPEFKTVEVTNMQIAFEAFLACLKMHGIQKYELFEK